MSPDLFTYQAPAYQRSDTSRAAAEAIKPDAARLRGECLKALQERDGTADEVAARIGRSVLSIRPRITELNKQGRIVDTGTRRANASGRSAAVWSVVHV